MDENLYVKFSPLNGDIKKWKTIVILKFASERQRWVRLVDWVQKKRLPSDVEEKITNVSSSYRL